MNFDEAHRAIKRGDVAGLRGALEKGLDVNLRNQNSWTLLMLTALAGNTRICRLLIDAGVELNSRNMFGETALSLAAFAGRPSLFRMLLAAGAALNGQPFGNGLADYLEWVREYSGQPAQMITRIQMLFEAERAHRNS